MRALGRFLLHVLLGSLLAALATAGGDEWDVSKPLNGITFQRAKAVKAPAVDGPAARFSRLHRIGGRRGSGRAASTAMSALLRAPAARQDRRPYQDHPYQNISTAGDFSTQYAIQCAWDGAPVWLLFDTGSSDTWAVQTGFECTDGFGGSGHGPEACGFGSPTIDGFGGGPIAELHFLLKYGSGERVVGPMGYSDVSCGGVRVARQQVGLANSTYWHGNNLTVGILGLAYPSLTSAYYGRVGNEAPWNSVSYTPFLTSAVTQGAMDPVFSVALVKNSSEGVLAWGGLPPMDWRAVRGGRPAVADLIIVSCRRRRRC